MAYYLRFFCRAGEQVGQAAMERLLDELLDSGDPLLGEWHGPFVDEVAASGLATKGPDGQARADWLTLEMHAGVAFIAESVIEVDPDCEYGIWGCDLLATITLSGDNPDGVLVKRIWAALVKLWSAVPCDDISGFEIASDAPEVIS
ncbi:hypothetical protein Aph01nite_09930 [Acrocarpospora phusangensis]|uniref:Uncharacterized protein n=1 Tax=Acrocarpospora phusangensis TaxID=1070424 RepID=A0A919ULW8_9ACTN|nr:hypothetical protein [Acrocarpospora phusangensis]GIH22683.1 hypothetical protein Aph01nite_09930 [Acrocarpospora phusangensis]